LSSPLRLWGAWGMSFLNIFGWGVFNCEGLIPESFIDHFVPPLGTRFFFLYFPLSTVPPPFASPFLKVVWPAFRGVRILGAPLIPCCFPSFSPPWTPWTVHPHFSPSERRTAFLFYPPCVPQNPANQHVCPPSKGRRFLFSFCLLPSFFPS